MAKCVHCGGNLKKDSRVCPWCGKAVGNKNRLSVKHVLKK